MELLTMCQRILVAVDGSHSSGLALSQAIEVAKGTNAEVGARLDPSDADLAVLAWQLRTCDPLTAAERTCVAKPITSNDPKATDSSL
jgi:nucleotide-binding universal stress UspA family protein